MGREVASAQVDEEAKLDTCLCTAARVMGSRMACREVGGNETIRSIPMERCRRERWMVQLVEGEDTMDLERCQQALTKDTKQEALPIPVQSSRFTGSCQKKQVVSSRWVRTPIPKGHWDKNLHFRGG